MSRPDAAAADRHHETMTRIPLLTAAAATLILLAGCGSDSDPAASPTEGTGATTSAASPTGRAAPTKKPATTRSTPVVTTVPTTPGPAGKVIDYETDDESGVVLTTAADASRLSGAPSDFRTFVTGQLAAATPGEGCTEKPQLYVSRIHTGGWASGGYFIPQCGGYATLWAKSGGAWTDVWSGQSLVECSTLEKYQFPVAIAGPSCLEGDETVDYEG
ncbi:MAG: hypothetical protein JWR55_2499 [Aeromicrobium sp.]|nr:hypothetical protein [Aeromicrobium sp.]